MDMNKVSEFIMRYNYTIVAFCFTVLMFLFFMLGVYISCEGGTLDGVKCVEPVMIDIVQVCQYNPYSCAKTCAVAMVEDKQAFIEEYGLD